MISLLTALNDTIRGFADLPATLERAIRETNGLIAEARAQLVLLHQAEKMSAQLDKMTTVADRLVEATAPMAAMAEEARRQMALTSEQLAATNRSLEQIVRFAEPFDRVGKRMVERLLRVTGRGGGEEGSGNP